MSGQGEVSTPCPLRSFLVVVIAVSDGKDCLSIVSDYWDYRCIVFDL